MWGSNDDPAKRAELERKKRDDARRMKIATELSEKKILKKEERKQKKIDDAKQAEDIEKKRAAGREEADKAAEALLEEGTDGQTTPNAASVPRLTRAGFGSGFGSSFSSCQTKKETQGKFMPPGSNQPGVQRGESDDSPPHRQTASASPPPAQNIPKLTRPF